MRTLALILLLLIGRDALAQTWQVVFRPPQANMSSAFFFNANEGVIGTGNYIGGARAAIYYTSDGGRSWYPATLPTAMITGQVIDIYFRTPSSGWATIHEAYESGWSGIYHSTDRGRTWKLVHQAGFPGGVRETAKGIFYTDRDVDQGVNYSSDAGKTWRHVADMPACLSIDFYDDMNGLATSQAYGSPPSHLVTTDGGMTWQNIATNAECWSVIGDPNTKSFVLSSEQNNAGTGSATAILTATSTAAAETYQQYYGAFALTGGLAASKGCVTMIYAQIRHAAGALGPGFLRTSNGGATWSQVDGPCNKADTRFGVTGGGAAIYAGDSVGNVWRTLDAGGLSVSELPSVQIISTTASTHATICDSATATLVLSYTGCGSLTPVGASFLNDFQNELSVVRMSRSPFNSGSRDSVVIQYRPRSVRNWTAQVRVSLQHSDGYREDTTLSLSLLGQQPRAGSLAFKGSGSPASLAFDSVSLCEIADSKFTIASTSCFDLTVASVTVSGPFRLRSSFSPFQLSSGDERSFVVEYTPTKPAPETGLLIFQHDQGVDTLRLSGIGFSASSALRLAPGSIETTACDSSSAFVPLQNITCSTIRQLTITSGPHVTAGIGADTIAAGSATQIAVHLASSQTGSGTDTLILHYRDAQGTHDTEVLVHWKVTEGTPAVDVAASLDFGTLSSCSDGMTDTVWVTNTGCGTLTLTSAVDDMTQGFSIVSAPSTVTIDGAEPVVVRYVPATSGGASLAHLILHTNVGDRTISLTATASSSVGSLELSTTNAPATLPCETSPLTVTIKNTACDSLYLISEELADGTASDFSITSPVSAILRRDAAVSIPLLFAPQDSLLRQDQLVLHFRRNDGSLYDTSIMVTGIGKSVPPIVLAIPTLSLSAQARGFVDVPVFALTSSVAPVSTADIVIDINTDLLTSFGLVSGEGAWSDATLTTRAIDRHTLRLSLTLPTARDVVPGKLFALHCRVTVTSELTTGASIREATLGDGSGNTGCFPTALALDSAAQFALDAQCGDLTISKTLAGQDITLDNITPNPTSNSAVIVTIANHTNEAVSAMLDVFTESGEREQTLPITLSPNTKQQKISLSLLNGEGIRYIRLRMPSGRVVATRSVLVVR